MVGTGNQTPYISSAILERVFKDPSMRLFEFNKNSLLASIPTMYAFPKARNPPFIPQCKAAHVSRIVTRRLLCMERRKRKK